MCQMLTIKTMNFVQTFAKDFPLGHLFVNMIVDNQEWIESLIEKDILWDLSILFLNNI